MTDIIGTHESVVVALSKDDLTKIKGIGTTTAEKLYNAKIVTVKQIAEMTPERLSETPGIGLATATKFITAAKNHLESSQKEEIASETIQVQETIKVESKPTSIEQYEMEEVIVDEIPVSNEEPRDGVGEAFESSQTQEKRFSDKFNYSRLATAQPPISKRAKLSNEAIEVEESKLEAEEITVIDSKTEEFVIDDERDFETQPKIEQVNEVDNEEEQLKGEEEVVIEAPPEIPIVRDQHEVSSSIEVDKEDYAPIKPKSKDFAYSRDSTFESIVRQQVSDTFKEAGCYEIPSSLESLKQFTTPLDYLGCKVAKASDDLRILFLFPVKRFDSEGTVLIDESKVELKSHSNKTDLGAYFDVEQVAKDLLQVRDSMYQDIISNQNILHFFQKYLQITLSLEKGFGNKSVVFLSGTTQYKVFIEPILLCYNPPKSMEKSLVFPYQRSSNLHAVTRADLAPLVAFLEKKYRMIEKRTKKTSSIKEYKQTEETLNSRVRYASIPILGYSVALLVIYFAELYFLLRLLNTIGFAVVGIYLSLLAFFYFRAYNAKKEFRNQFETPYYLQNLEFSETDLLDFKVELTDELLTQFGYECLEKNAKFGVIERSEANALKQTVEIKRAEPEFKKMFEPEQIKADNVAKPTTKYGMKYQDFLQEP